MDGENDRILRLEKTSHSRVSSLDPDKTCVITAISPIEAHGPHLPCGQDWLEAIALMETTIERVAEIRKDWTFLVLPPVPLGDDCLPHLGSLNMPASIVEEVAYRMMLPFARHGFRRLAFSSFHGGPRHMTALESAAHRLSSEHENTAAISLFSSVVASVAEGVNIFYDAIADHPDRNIDFDQVNVDWHAGFVETSIALHLWPELVDDGWQDLPPAVRKQKERTGEASYFFGGKQNNISEKINKVVDIFDSIKSKVEHYTNCTYSGYPALSSAEMGRLMFDHAAGICTEAACTFLDAGTDMQLHTPLWKYRKLILDKGLNRILNEWVGLYQIKPD